MEYKQVVEEQYDCATENHTQAVPPADPELNTCENKVSETDIPNFMDLEQCDSVNEARAQGMPSSDPEPRACTEKAFETDNVPQECFPISIDVLGPEKERIIIQVAEVEIQHDANDETSAGEESDSDCIIVEHVSQSEAYDCQTSESECELTVDIPSCDHAYSHPVEPVQHSAVVMSSCNEYPSQASTDFLVNSVQAKSSNVTTILPLPSLIREPDSYELSSDERSQNDEHPVDGASVFGVAPMELMDMGISGLDDENGCSVIENTSQAGTDFSVHSLQANGYDITAILPLPSLITEPDSDELSSCEWEHFGYPVVEIVPRYDEGEVSELERSHLSSEVPCTAADISALSSVAETHCDNKSSDTAVASTSHRVKQKRSMEVIDVDALPEVQNTATDSDEAVIVIKQEKKEEVTTVVTTESKKSFTSCFCPHGYSSATSGHYHCRYCGFSCRFVTKLLRHEKGHAAYVAEKAVSSQKASRYYSCHQCCRYVGTCAKNLRLHEIRVHAKSRQTKSNPELKTPSATRPIGTGIMLETTANRLRRAQKSRKAHVVTKTVNVSHDDSKQPELMVCRCSKGLELMNEQAHFHCRHCLEPFRYQTLVFSHEESVHNSKYAARVTICADGREVVSQVPCYSGNVVLPAAWRGRKARCPICNQTFVHRNSLRNHFICVHEIIRSGETLFSCIPCRYDTSHGFAFAEHRDSEMHHSNLNQCGRISDSVQPSLDSDADEVAAMEIPTTPQPSTSNKERISGSPKLVNSGGIFKVPSSRSRFYSSVRSQSCGYFTKQTPRVVWYDQMKHLCSSQCLSGLNTPPAAVNIPPPSPDDVATADTVTSRTLRSRKSLDAPAAKLLTATASVDNDKEFARLRSSDAPVKKKCTARKSTAQPLRRVAFNSTDKKKDASIANKVSKTGTTSVSGTVDDKASSPEKVVTIIDSDSDEVAAMEIPTTPQPSTSDNERTSGSPKLVNSGGIFKVPSSRSRCAAGSHTVEASPVCCSSPSDSPSVASISQQNSCKPATSTAGEMPVSVTTVQQVDGSHSSSKSVNSPVSTNETVSAVISSAASRSVPVIGVAKAVPAVTTVTHTSTMSNRPMYSLHRFSAETLWSELCRRGGMHSCDCGVSFMDSALYLLHRSCHSDLAPLKCAFCDHKADSNYDFQAHLLDHKK